MSTLCASLDHHAAAFGHFYFLAVYFKFNHDESIFLQPVTAQPFAPFIARSAMNPVVDVFWCVPAPAAACPGACPSACPCRASATCRSLSNLAQAATVSRCRRSGPHDRRRGQVACAAT